MINSKTFFNIIIFPFSFFIFTFIIFIFQESELLVTNLGDKLLQDHEVLCDVSSMKLLANLHESLVRFYTLFCLIHKIMRGLKDGATLTIFHKMLPNCESSSILNLSSWMKGLWFVIWDGKWNVIAAFTLINGLGAQVR